MICKKCDFENFDGDTHCSMCGAKLKSKRRRVKAEISQYQEPELGKRGSKVFVIAIIAIVGVGCLALIGRFLPDALRLIETFTQVETTVGSTNAPANISAQPGQTNASTSLFSNEEIAFMNRMNGHTGNHGIHMTQNHIYISQFGGTIAVFDHEFNQLPSIDLNNDWHTAATINVFEDAIYFTTWEGNFYRHDLTTGTNELIRNGVFSNQIDGRMMTYFSFDDAWYSLGIFSYNLDTGIGTTISDSQAISSYFNDPRSDRFFYIDGITLYETTLTNNERTLVSDFAWTIALNDQYLFWSSFNDGFYRKNLATSEQTFVELDFMTNRMAVIGDQILVNNFDGDLYTMLVTDEIPVRIATDVNHFVVVGNYIIFENWASSLNFYVMNRNGGDRRVLIQN